MFDKARYIGLTHAPWSASDSEGDLLSVPGLRRDGQRISLEFTIVPLMDNQGRVHGIAAVMRDVTSRFEEMTSLKQKLAEAVPHPNSR